MEQIEAAIGEDQLPPRRGEFVPLGGDLLRSLQFWNHGTPTIAATLSP